MDHLEYVNKGMKNGRPAMRAQEKRPCYHEIFPVLPDSTRSDFP
jgi:hypothetical protein